MIIFLLVKTFSCLIFMNYYAFLPSSNVRADHKIQLRPDCINQLHDQLNAFLILKVLITTAADNILIFLCVLFQTNKA